MNLITIDGSYGEGGGQIIRTSLSLSAMTGRPVEIANIRARRSKPGLQPQHLTAVRAASSLCDARLVGDAVGSTRLRFSPRTPPRVDRYRFDIGTAGATTLVMQTVLLPLVLADSLSSVPADSPSSVPADSPSSVPADSPSSVPADSLSSVTVTGGTHVPHSPPADYLEAVFVPALRDAGLDAAFSYDAAGFYPRGGGRIVAGVGRSSIRPVEWVDRGALRSIRARVVTSSLPAHVAERGEATIRKRIEEAGLPVTVERRDLPSNGPGAAVVVLVECERGWGGFTGIGERGKPMERVAEDACAGFVEWWRSGAACDERLADQLVPPLSFAPGTSRWTTPRITEHLRTVLSVVEQFLSIRYRLEERADGSGVVELTGVG